MWQVIKIIIFYFSITIPISAPTNIDTKTGGNALYETSEKMKPFSIMPIDRIWNGVNGFRWKRIVLAARP